MTPSTIQVRLNGDMVSLTGRLAVIVLWLIRSEARINAIGHGELNFNMAGRKVRPKIVEFEPEMEI